MKKVFGQPLSPEQRAAKIEAFAASQKWFDLRGKILDLMPELQKIEDIDDVRIHPENFSQETIALVNNYYEEFVSFLRTERLYSKEETQEARTANQERIQSYDGYINNVLDKVDACFEQDGEDPNKCIRSLDGYVGAGENGYVMRVDREPDKVAKFNYRWIEACENTDVTEELYFEELGVIYSQIGAMKRMEGNQSYSQMFAYDAYQGVIIMDKVDGTTLKDYAGTLTIDQVRISLNAMAEGIDVGIDVDTGLDDIMLSSDGRLVFVDYHLMETGDTSKVNYDQLYSSSQMKRYITRFIANISVMIDNPEQSEAELLAYAKNRFDFMKD